MAHINSTLYAMQDIVSRRHLEATNYPDRTIAFIIEERLNDMWLSSREKNEKLDWSTLAISTRFDALVDGLIVSCRINAT